MTDEEILAAIADHQKTLEPIMKEMVQNRVEAAIAPLRQRLAEVQRKQSSTVIH